MNGTTQGNAHYFIPAVSNIKKHQSLTMTHKQTRTHNRELFPALESVQREATQGREQSEVYTQL